MNSRTATWMLCGGIKSLGNFLMEYISNKKGLKNTYILNENDSKYNEWEL